MNFSDALAALKSGKKLTREHWNGKGQWVAIQWSDQNSMMWRPYIYISPVDHHFVPWIASQTDLLAEDWAEYTEQ